MKLVHMSRSTSSVSQPCIGCAMQRNKSSYQRSQQSSESMKLAVEYTHGSNSTSGKLQPLKYCKDLMRDLHLKRKLR